MPFAQCALHKECIAPEGSSRLNHRQDQAAITTLAGMHGYDCDIRQGMVYRHQDDLGGPCLDTWNGAISESQNNRFIQKQRDFEIKKYGHPLTNYTDAGK